MTEYNRFRVRCPECRGHIPCSKLLLRHDFRCIRCQTPLHPSLIYTRVLVLLSAASSCVLLWAVGIRDWRLFLFYFPVGFLILTLVVRVAPFVVRPRLYVGKPGGSHLITLGISEGSSRDDGFRR
jgi:hypothetical protein